MSERVRPEDMINQGGGPYPRSTETAPVSGKFLDEPLLWGDNGGL